MKTPQLKSVFKYIDRFYNAILDFFFPNCCLNCDRITINTLCNTCKPLVKTELWESDLFPDLDHIYSIFKYRNIVKKIIKEVKYRKQGSGIQFLIKEFISEVKRPEADVIIPIPLHGSKMLERGFNQAKIISQSICEKYSLRLVDNCLMRVRQTTALYGLSREQRQIELNSVFALLDADMIRGKRVLLVDDICTTGTTLSFCAKLLKEAGATQVSAFVLARSVKSL